LTLTEESDVQVGTPTEGILEIGERIEHSLKLDIDTTLDIEVKASDGSPLDSYIRIYDTDGELIAENDEVTYEDDALDAGFLGFELRAGEYQIEVGSFGDSSTGGYILSVVTAQP
jgi:hypothetical protein